MLLIALGIGRKINYCYLLIFFCVVLSSFMQMILVLGLLFVVMYKSVVIYQNTTLCHKLRVCNFITYNNFNSLLQMLYFQIVGGRYCS